MKSMHKLLAFLVVGTLTSLSFAQTEPAPIDQKDQEEVEETEEATPELMGATTFPPAQPLPFPTQRIVQEQPTQPIQPPAPAPQAEEQPAPRTKLVGAQLDIGAPDGIALGLTVRPLVKWAHLNVALTHNVLALGVRAGLTLDPINFLIAPTLTVEGGHAFANNIPGEEIKLSYDYLNLHPGIALGRREGSFRFFLRGGVTWVDMKATNVNSMFDNANVRVGDVSITGRVAPSAKLGFQLYF